MRSKLLFSLFLGMFLIGIVSAIDATLGTSEQGKCIVLTQTCGNCSFVNISQITYQKNSTTFLTAPVSMALNGTTRYTYNFCSTEGIGRYVYDSYGDPDGVTVPQSVDFFINPTGEQFDLIQGLMLVGQLSMIVLFVTLGLTFSKERWKLKSFFFMMAMLMGVILLNSTRIIAAQSGSLNTMGNMGLIAGIIVLIFMIAVIFIYFTIDVITSLKQKKERKWV